MAKHRVHRDPVVQPQDQSIKHVALTKGKVAIVDADDYAAVMEFNWNAQKSHSGTFYAKGSHGGPLLHRFVLRMSDPKIQIDHANGNTLDNRKSNLRVATHEQNRQNRGAYKNSKSGYAGVHWHRRDKVWVVYVNTNGKRTYCGEYEDKETAIAARIAAEVEQHGEFAFSNRHIKTNPS